MATAWRQRFDFDLVHAGASRPAPHGHLESLHGLEVTLDHRLDPAITEIADAPPDALEMGDVFREQPEANALN